MSKSTLLRQSALVAVALALPVSAHAAGFYLQESSVSSLGSAFSGSTTTINDASTVFLIRLI